MLVACRIQQASGQSSKTAAWRLLAMSFGPGTRVHVVSPSSVADTLLQSVEVLLLGPGVPGFAFTHSLTVLVIEPVQSNFDTDELFHGQLPCISGTLLLDADEAPLNIRLLVLMCASQSQPLER